MRSKEERQTRGTAKRSYKQWATVIASSLTGEQLDAFTAMLDGDANNEFLHQMNVLNQIKNPGSY